MKHAGRSAAIAVAGLALVAATAGMALPASAGSAGAKGMEIATRAKGNGKGNKPGPGASNNLSYNGGAVSTAPVIYLVLWGSQWNNGGDPSGEVSYLERFYGGLFGSADTWSTSTTQYCQGVPVGTTNCATATTSKTFVGHPTASPLPAANVWSDTASAAPGSPTQSNLGAEAVRAASHFGNPSPNNVQYVIATAHGDNPSGFGTQYCAWHSSANSTAGTIAYTNLPYITDAGAACGQNFVNSIGGLLDGVSIVSGHEYAETITDMFPNGGWLDKRGAENGDKCAWVTPGTPGGSADITLSTGTFAIQTLWSNSWNNNSGGCVRSYVNGVQHQ